MKIAVLQQNIIRNNPQENITKTNVAIDDNAGFDLYVLPEMFNTGFGIKLQAPAPNKDDDARCWMVKKAKETNAAICGSVAVESNGGLYNRCYFVKPDGSILHYDKHHLFSLGGEEAQYTAGNERVVVEYQGWHIMLQICYDLRFPVFSRNRGDYDALVYVANWPANRIDVWKTLLRARALENQCYVIGANRVGSDTDCMY